MAIMATKKARAATGYIGIAQAKNLLSELVNRVAYGGERILLASRGRPKAALISLADLHQLEACSPITPTQRQAALALADRVRTQILAERRGRPFPDLARDLEQLRHERLQELPSPLAQRKRR